MFEFIVSIAIHFNNLLNGKRYWRTWASMNTVMAQFAFSRWDTTQISRLLSLLEIINKEIQGWITYMSNWGFSPALSYFALFCFPREHDLVLFIYEGLDKRFNKISLKNDDSIQIKKVLKTNDLVFFPLGQVYVSQFTNMN